MNGGFDAPKDLLQVHGWNTGPVPFYYRPAIRLSYTLSEIDEWGQWVIGVSQNVNPHPVQVDWISGFATPHDVVFRTNPNTPEATLEGDLILSSQRAGQALRFGTTPATAMPDPVTGREVWDQERMTILHDGKVGVDNPVPLEKLTIGREWFFHDGGAKYMGWNALSNGTYAFSDDNPMGMPYGAATVKFWSNPDPSRTWSHLFLTAYAKGIGGQPLQGENTIEVTNEFVVITNPVEGSVMEIGRGSSHSTHASAEKVLIKYPVCIGTNDPGIVPGSTTEKFKLAVNGSVRARELIVENTAWTAWPDYVFQSTYNLLTLSEVESFVREYGHLPGLPSAEQVEQDGGIAVGTLQRKLLEKVEEITLYLIALQKENGELRGRIQRLESQN